MKKSVLIIFVCAVCLVVCVFPYIKAEVLTLRYGDEFNDLQKQTNILTDAKYYRVISYDNNTAKVFYVSDSGDLLTFKKGSDENWELIKWKTFWSNTGSASEFMWPYYR